MGTQMVGFSLNVIKRKMGSIRGYIGTIVDINKVCDFDLGPKKRSLGQ